MRGLTLLLLVLFLVTSAGMCVISKKFTLKDTNPCCAKAERTFSIFELEFPKEQCTEQLISLMPKETRHEVHKHLDLDYVFMIGCYLGIMCLNLWIYLNGKDKGKNFGKFLLLLFCCLQPIAWALDIVENMAIEHWIWSGHIHSDYTWFNTRSYIKFAIGLGGAFFPLLILLIRAFQKKPEAVPLPVTLPGRKPQ